MAGSVTPRHRPSRSALVLYAVLIESPASTMFGLLDLLYAYAYDARTTMCEPTVGSAWTIARLSGLCSWMEVGGSAVALPRLMRLRRSATQAFGSRWLCACADHWYTPCIGIGS